MSTKWCHQCGSEFVARVDVCPDCGVDLEAEPPGASNERGEAGGRRELDDDAPRPGDSVVYELHEWSEESRHLLDRLLNSGWLPGPGDRMSIFNARERAQELVGPAITGKTRPGVPHMWQGTDLIVPYDEQERAEAFIDQVELAALIALDPEAEKLAYDLSDLVDDQLDLISDALLAEEIPHGFDDETGELVVHEVDEEKVEAVLDAVDFPDALPVDDGAEGDGDGDDDDVDPLAAQNAMSDLFVAADRLRKDARDPDGVLNLVAAAGVAASLPVPYGFDEADWTVIVDRAGGMVALIEADDTDDETIEEEADRLRTLLRQYV